MKKYILLCGLLSATSFAAPLSTFMPAGAIAAFETKDASGMLDKLSLLQSNLLGKTIDAETLAGIEMMEQQFVQAFGTEGFIGVYGLGVKFDPHVLAVTRVSPETLPTVESLLGSKGKAFKESGYTFYRTKDGFYGSGKNLAYFASNIDLMRAFLRRLDSSKDLPRLANHEGYKNVVGQQGEGQLKAYLNSALAVKALRNSLDEIKLSGIVTPVLDMFSTIGQVGLNLNFTNQGLAAESIHAPNPEGKDKPLYRLMTATTPEFETPKVIPANASSVSIQAFDGKTYADYSARWLARFELFDPEGSFASMKLSEELNDASVWLGNEEAMVNVLPNPLLQDPKNPAEGIVYIYTLKDPKAAEEHLSRWLPALNSQLKTLYPEYVQWLSDISKDLGGGASPLDPSILGMVQTATPEYQYKISGSFLMVASRAEDIDAVLNATEFLSEDATFSHQGGSAYMRSSAIAQKASGVDINKHFSKWVGAPLLAVPEAKQASDIYVNLISTIQDNFQGAEAYYEVKNNIVYGKASLLFDW